ncbi:hypothetical protein ACTGUS_12575, partial [Streptococcus suis]
RSLTGLFFVRTPLPAQTAPYNYIWSGAAGETGIGTVRVGGSSAAFRKPLLSPAFHIQRYLR